MPAQLSTTLKKFKEKHEFQTACVLHRKLRESICRVSAPCPRTAPTCFPPTHCASRFDPVCFATWLSCHSSRSFDKHHSRVLGAFSCCFFHESLCLIPGCFNVRPQVLVLECIVDVRQLMTTSISPQKTSHDRPTSCGFEHDPLVTSTDVKICVPDVRASSNVRKIDGTDE